MQTHKRNAPGKEVSENLSSKREGEMRWDFKGLILPHIPEKFKAKRKNKFNSYLIPFLKFPPL